MRKTDPGGQLLDAIRRDPDDVASCLVYADTLTAKNDPHGELIVLMHGLSKAPDDAHLGRALDAFMTKHRALFFGDLAKQPGLFWDFHLGFLRAVRYVPDGDRAVAEVVRTVLGLPVAAALREFTVFTRVDAEITKVKSAEKARPPTLDAVRCAQRFESLDDAEDAGRDALWLDVEVHEPEDLVRIAKLSSLEYLEIRTSQTALPAALAELRRLRRLDVDWNHDLRRIPEEVFGIETLGYVSMYDCPRLGLHMARVNNLLAGFTRARATSRRRVFETRLFTGAIDLALASRKGAERVHDLLAALDSNVAQVREAAQTGLQRVLPDPVTNGVDGARFALLGKTNFDKTDLARKLAARGATLAPKFDAKSTTHAIVGESPGGQQRIVGETPLVLESHLTTLFAQKAAPARSGAKAKARATAGPSKAKARAPRADAANDVAAALTSRDDAVVLGALTQLREAGSTPPELFTRLVVVTQDVALKKSREVAKKLLATTAPSALNAALKTHLKSSLLLESMGETKRADRIGAFCRAAKLDPLELAELLARRAGVALHVLFAKAPAPRTTQVLEAIVQVTDGVRTLDLSTKELRDVPKVVGSVDVPALDLSGNHLTKWPEVVTGMKRLTRLDLSDNRIGTIPDAAKGMRLVALDMSGNRIRRFPSAVLSMTTLEELGLGNSEEYVSNEARIKGLPKEIGNLKRLRKFDYSFNILEEIPVELFALANLESLRLFQSALPKQIPAEIARLQKLRHLDVAYSNWASKKKELQALLPKCTVET